MVGEQSEVEAGTPDGLRDTRAKTRRKGGKDRQKEVWSWWLVQRPWGQRVPDFGAARLASQGGCRAGTSGWK